MATKYSGFIQIKSPLDGTKLQNDLMKSLNAEKTGKEIHQILGDMCDPYVPKNEGDLRASMKAYPKSVKWEKPYAHYQYMGEVYGPNYPIIRSGIVMGWWSPPNSTKKPTGRELGVPGSWKGWKFGYTTSGTSHHWLNAAMEGHGLNTFSNRVTALLKSKVAKKKK